MNKIDLQIHIAMFKEKNPNKNAIWRGKKTNAFMTYLKEFENKKNEFDWKCKNLVVVKPKKYARCSIWKLQIFGAIGQECCYMNDCGSKK